MTRRAVLAVVFLLLAAVSASAVDDYRTRIAVLPMKNATQEARYDSVCQTVTETVALVFRLMGKYLVVESDEDPGLLQVDATSMETLGAFAEASRYDEVLVGLTSKDDSGVLTFRLSLFNRAEGKYKYESVSTARGILEVFDAADEITVGLLSQVSDIHIGFGGIEVAASSGTGSYTVYLNDARIRNPKTMLGKVLNGTYTLSIHQQRILGDTEIYRGEIKVFEDETTKVSFVIPSATAAETAYIASQKAKLLATPEDQIESLLSGIAAFQQQSQGIDYDEALAAQQAQALTAAGARAVEMLKAATAQADGAFYAKNPDFKTARQQYQELSRMVSNAFDYAAVTNGTLAPFASPALVRVAPNGTVVVLDASEKIRITSSPDGRTLAQEKLVDDALSTFTDGQLAFDASSRAYYVHPELGAIVELDSALQPIRTIPIPGLQQDPQVVTRIAVSDDGLIYLVSGSQVVVFEPGASRESEIEKALQDVLQEHSVAAVNGLFIDHGGLLNILDAADGTILRVDLLGTLRSTVQLPGLMTDSAAAVDGLGYFYVTIPEEHRIAKYSPAGQLIASFGGYGAGPGEFSSPQDLAVGPTGTIYVADTYNNRVQVLVPTTPPILLADVAGYGMTLARRETAAEKAQARLGITLENIRARNVVVPVIEGAGLLGAAAGLAITGGVFNVMADDAYLQYQAATVPATVSSLHDTVARNWIAGSVSTLGSEIAVLGAASLLTSALVNGARNAVAAADTISQIQSFEMDGEYELDRSRYRSLSAAESIGFWTGVLPPILGAGTLFALQNVPLDTGYLGQIVAGVTVAIPPFLSNAYAGHVDGGLIASAIVADALTAVSAALYLAGAPQWTPVDLGPAVASALPGVYPALNNAWKTMQRTLALNTMVAALGVRLAAGAMDMGSGWIEAKNTNLYRAMKKTPAPEVSLGVLPDQGLAVAVSFRL